MFLDDLKQKQKRNWFISHIDTYDAKSAHVCEVNGMSFDPHNLARSWNWNNVDVANNNFLLFSIFLIEVDWLNSLLCIFFSWLDFLIQLKSETKLKLKSVQLLNLRDMTQTGGSHRSRRRLTAVICDESIVKCSNLYQ